MAEGDISGFGDRDVARIGASVSFYEHNPRYPTSQRQFGGPPSGMMLFCGILTSAVTAASPDGKTGATNFTFKIWRPDIDDSSSPRQYIEDTDDTTGVNRSLTTGTSGSYIECMYVNGEYRPIWIDCV